MHSNDYNAHTDMAESRQARPMGMHDTAELERQQRAERRAFFIMLAVCAVVLAYVVLAYVVGAL